MYIKNFKKLSYKNVPEAGGKGASLGELTQAKIPVPPGFVVLASAFDRFLEETDINIEIDALLKKVKIKDLNSVEGVSIEIRDLIKKADFPQDLAKEITSDFKKLKAKLVAVRSSATAEDSKVASWAGELETYLNVTQKNLLESVKLCWSSLFTPRAIFYRFEQKLHKTKVSVAVVIQAMVQSEISGICFTAHPVTRDLNQLVLEAGYGLGEAIVGGQITPDTYVLVKGKNPKILDKNISEQTMMIIKKGTQGTEEKTVPKTKQNKQKLTDSQIKKIAIICQKIEEHYGSPQDIEWAYQKNKFYITQSRPITTL